jgi:hypothetical protein
MLKDSVTYNVLQFQVFSGKNNVLVFPFPFHNLHAIGQLSGSSTF